MLGLLTAAAWWLIKRDLRPLENMAVTADAISAGDLSLRVEPAEPRTEVGRLGLSLNTMLGRIEVAFAERAATEDKLRRFLADASHELRTPLTSIRGYSEMFERAKDDPEDLDLAMRRIEEESKRMGVMVEELLVLARLGEGREPEKLPVDLARVVDDCVSDARAAAPARDITLERVETATVMGDDHQLHQVVHNLLSNAVRHTPPEARIRLTLAASDGYATVAVADDGPGLEPDVAAKVFEPFFRADKSRARETGGAGLGLAIVAAIVESHRGTVRLDTAPGAGATFTVTLPLPATRAPDPGLPAGARPRPRRSRSPRPASVRRALHVRERPCELPETAGLRLVDPARGVPGQLVHGRQLHRGLLPARSRRTRRDARARWCPAASGCRRAPGAAPAARSAGGRARPACAGAARGARGRSGGAGGHRGRPPSPR